jgi:hypothetical protein
MPLDNAMPRSNNSKANPSPTSIPQVLTGVAGEYFVAAELSRRGYIASISLRNTRGIDILATNQAATRSITIQCKTNQSGARSWMLSEKSEDFFAPDHYYVCVALGSVPLPKGHDFTSCPATLLLSSLRTLTSDGFARLGEVANSTSTPPCAIFQIRTTLTWIGGIYSAYDNYA